MRIASILFFVLFHLFSRAQTKTDTLCADVHGKMLPSEKLTCWLHYCDLNHKIQPSVVYRLLQTADSFLHANQLTGLQNELNYQWGNYYFTLHKFDSAEHFFQNALSPTHPLTDDFTCKISLKLAATYIETDNYRKYTEIFEKLNELTKSTINNSQKGQLLITEGNFNSHIELYHESIENYQKALDVFKEQKDTFLMVEVFQKLGLVYEKSGNFPVSLDFFEKANRAYQKLEFPYGAALSELYKGQIYLKMGDLEPALKASLSAHSFFYATGYPLFLIQSQKQLGQIYFQMKNFTDSKNSLNEALRLCHKISDKQLLAETHLLLGQLLNEMNKPTEAEAHFKSALLLAEVLKNDNLRITIFSELTSHYTRLSNFKLAMNFQTQQYLIEKQSDEKNRLFKQSLNDDKWNSLLQENENRQMELLTSVLRERHLKQTWFLLFLGISIILLAGALIFALITYNRINKVEKIIVSKQHKINRQHQYILKLKSQLELTEQNTNRFFTITTQNIFEPVRSLENLLTELQQNFQHCNTLNKEPLVLSYNLLENLLYWSRNQLEKIALEPQEVNVNELIETLIEFQKPRMLTKKTTIRFYPEQPINGYFDKKLLSIAIRNIIDNAIKFSTNDSDIIVRSKQDYQHIILTVTDEGIGMTREQMTRLFSAKNYESAGTHGEKGGGIGLTLAKTFIERNFGQLTIESSIAYGTKVTVLLPASKANELKG